MVRFFRAALLLMAIALFSLSAFRLQENGPDRRLSDLTPGVRYDAGPYIAPVGCISRRWRESDYMPAACRRGQQMDGVAIGLEEDQWMKYQLREPRRYQWLRAGPDVVLAACPFLTACKVYQVIPDRFAPKPQDSPTIEVARPSTLRTPPLGYRLTRHVHAFFMLPLGVFLLVFALLPDRALMGGGRSA